MDGYKTYLAAIGIVATGVAAYATGNASVTEAIVIVLNGFGLGAIRNTAALNK